MNKFLKTLATLALGTMLLPATAFAAFASNQLAPTPANGQILQTNGTASAWVSTTTLGFPVIPVTSVFGRTGAVIAQMGDYTTAQITEVTNLFFTNARAIAATLTGYSSGAGTISSSDSILSAIQKLNGNIAALVTGVSSVSNVDGSITTSPTTGAVVHSLNIAHANNWTTLQQFVNASTSLASVTKELYIGGTATTTIDSTGNIVIPSGSSLTNTGVSNGCATWASGVLGSTGVVCGSGGGGSVTSVTGTYPVLSSGGSTPAISLAFSTTTLINAGTGISTSTSAGGAISIANTGVISNSCPGGFLSCSGTNPSTFTLGTLGVANGGTGDATLPVSQLLYGATTGSVQSVATSSIGAGTGLTFSGTAGAQVGGTNGTYSVNTTQNITTLSNLTTGFVQATAGVLSSAALTSGQVTTALTFTPFGGTNPLPIANGGTASTTALANAIKYFDPTAAFETASTSFVRVASGNVGNGTSSPFASFSTTIASNTPAFVAWALGSSTPALYVGSANQNGDVGFGTSVPDSPVTINMNTSSAPPALGAFTGTTLHTIGVDGLANRVVQDSFGGATVYSLRRADGTNGSPTALASGDNVFTFGGAGWNGSAYTSTKAQYNMIATQPWTTTANGIGFNWLVTQNNSTLLFMAMTLDNTGHLGIGTTTPFAGLQIATSSVNTLQNGTFGQFAITDTSAGVNLKNWLFTSDSGAFTLGTTSDLFATGTPALTITLNQNFGIGSSSPAQKLSVNGIIYSGSGGFQFPDGTIQTTAAAGGSNFFTNSGINTFLSTGTDLGIGSSTPFGELGIHANSGTNYPGNLLFTIGSSTASATTTLLSVSNSGVENLATALVITGNNGIIGSLNSASGISFDAFHSFTADSAGGATFGTRFVGAGGLAYSFTARNSGGATLSAISVLNGADTNSGTTALVGIATSSPFGTLSVNMGSTSPAFVIGSAGSSTLAFIVSSANNLGAVGIGSSTPYGQFSDVSASSTDPNRPIATFAGFEAGVGNAVQFIIDEYGRVFYHGDTPTFGACGTSPSFISPSNDETGTIQVGGGVITDCTLIFAHPFPTGSGVHLFANIINSTGIAALNINQATGNLTQVDIRGTSIGSQQIQYFVKVSR